MDVWFPKILPGDIEGDYFAKETKYARFLTILMDKGVENLDDHGISRSR